MKKYSLFLTAVSVMVICGWSAAFGGDIKGSVQCTIGKPAVGAVVSLSGSSFSAVTNKKGASTLRQVPTGTYSLTIELSGTVLRTINNVSVSGRVTTDLGLIIVACEPCANNAGCPADQFCSKVLGACGAQGSCQTRPALCTSVYDPVCGCDGKTYDNECEASAAGVSIASLGACVIPPVLCLNNAYCMADQLCSKVLGACSSQGTCQTRPALCAQVFDPVCGCDGKTYANNCEAALAGVSVASQGACLPPPPPATCMFNMECPPPQYCAKADGDCGGQGACTARPIGCLDILDPVCGCDGKTYANVCEAAVAGVSVASQGAFVPPPPPATCVSNIECTIDRAIREEIRRRRDEEEAIYLLLLAA